jgi:hypothetical protein
MFIYSTLLIVFCLSIFQVELKEVAIDADLSDTESMGSVDLVFSDGDVSEFSDGEGIFIANDDISSDTVKDTDKDTDKDTCVE